MDDKNTNPKQAIIDRLQSATNILVTVSNNPTVDELAACLGLTLWVNKIGKHGTAVFSGEVPNTLEFLKPEETLEKTTDSLRDFIISLDKSKADKLRYKVEDSVVRIFITPYKTNLTADDLEFSQGDFNVDMVIALGVTTQADLDTAISAHGRILHDATVATITVNETSDLGAINWHVPAASSLSELVVDLGEAVGKDQLDDQIATALLTGVVAETNRFSNEKTTPQTMSVSAALMAAGANQQLVASKLEESPAAAAPEESQPSVDVPSVDPGMLEITHAEPEAPTAEEPAPSLPTPVDEAPAPEEPSEAAPEEEQPVSRSKRIVEPPSLGGVLTANSRPDDVVTEPTSDPFTQAAMPGANDQPLLEHNDVTENDQTPAPATPAWMPAQEWMAPPKTPPAEDQPPAEEAPLPPEQSTAEEPAEAPEPAQPAETPEPESTPETLAQIEQEVESPHVATEGITDVDAARDEVLKAINAAPDTTPTPVEALNAQPIDLHAPEEPAQPEGPSINQVLADQSAREFNPQSFDIINDTPSDTPLTQPEPGPAADLTGPVDQPFTLPVPQSPLTPPPADPTPPTDAKVTDPNAPPPVPPPMMPPGFPPAQ